MNQVIVGWVTYFRVSNMKKNDGTNRHKASL
ncbi:hypothetical protein RCO48_15745 [Peribacillus frigoritolerans]|nr:hypothetical protein [Peribacillus frigoritolerans]